jgi:hypothetical protein
MRINRVVNKFFGSTLGSLLGRAVVGAQTLRKPFDWELTICAMFKDEAENLEEWLQFHSLAGVNHFVLYDDGSSDNFGEVLEPWVRAGTVSLGQAEGRTQEQVYNECLRSFRMRTRWLAFIDLDEFLFSPTALPLHETLAQFRGHPAVFVHWRLFGSNGHVERPVAPVLESFTRSLSVESAVMDDFDHRLSGHLSDYVTSWARDGKSIVNPRAVLRFGIHLPKSLLYGCAIDENGRPAARRTPPGTEFSCDVVRINHYWSKSVVELHTKVNRGVVSRANRLPMSLKRSLEREKTLNEIDDRLILEVREEMQCRAVNAQA